MKTSTLMLLATGFMIWASPVAAAQDLKTASEGVVACMDIEDMSEKLSCYDAASSNLALALERASEVELAEAVSDSQPSAESDVNEDSQTTQTFASADPSEQATREAQQVAAVDTETNTVPSSGLPSWLPRITFGSDREVEKEPDEFQTQITRIQRNNLGRHFFTTTEGHVWRQRQIEEIRAPSTLPADAILYQNVTGGVRIKILETNRSYNVNRVE